MYVPAPLVGLMTLSWSVELEALEEVDTDELGGCGPVVELKLVSLAHL